MNRGTQISEMDGQDCAMHSPKPRKVGLSITTVERGKVHIVGDSAYLFIPQQLSTTYYQVSMAERWNWKYIANNEAFDGTYNREISFDACVVR